MPADIFGSEVLEESADQRRSFRFVPGPIFAQLLMADEINRASPRTQSALLQAMQEHHVSVAGERHDLPNPFHVLATQNPLEQEGTYPLPEAQLDRFLMQIDVPYPDRDAEKRILIETTGDKDQDAAAGDDRGRSSSQRNASCGVCQSASPLSRRFSISFAPRGRARAITALTQHIAWGPGPRAAQSLMLATPRARTCRWPPCRRRCDDVVALAEPVLKHRMALTFAARAEGETHARHHRATDPAARLMHERCAPALIGPKAQRVSAPRRRCRAGYCAPAAELDRRGAKEVASSVVHGMHGRRRAGIGETFWQFRPFVAGESSTQRRLAPLGPRRSSLYPRTRMGSGAHGLDLDRSFASMGFVSQSRAAIEDRPRAGARPRRRPICWCAAASAWGCSA